MTQPSTLPAAVAQYLAIERAIPEWAIRHFKLTWDPRLSAIAIPIEDRIKYRSLVNYDLATGKSDHGPNGKMFWAPKTTRQTAEPLPPFPSWRDWRDPDCEVVVEGEFDALIAIANGMLAVSGTAGAGTLTDEWADALTGQRRCLLYDHDDSGRHGALKAAMRLTQAGCRAFIASWPADRPVGWDVTDHFRTGGTADEIRALLACAVEFVPAALPRKMTPRRRSLGGVAL